MEIVNNQFKALCFFGAEIIFQSLLIYFSNNHAISNVITNDKTKDKYKCFSIKPVSLKIIIGILWRI